MNIRLLSTHQHKHKHIEEQKSKGKRKTQLKNSPINRQNKGHPKKLQSVLEEKGCSNNLIEDKSSNINIKINSRATIV